MQASPALRWSCGTPLELSTGSVPPKMEGTRPDSGVPSAGARSGSPETDGPVRAPRPHDRNARSGVQGVCRSKRAACDPEAFYLAGEFPELLRVDRSLGMLGILHSPAGPRCLTGGFRGHAQVERRFAMQSQVTHEARSRDGLRAPKGPTDPCVHSDVERLDARLRMSAGWLADAGLPTECEELETAWCRGCAHHVWRAPGWTAWTRLRSRA